CIAFAVRYCKLSLHPSFSAPEYWLRRSKGDSYMPDFYRINAEQALAELKSSHEGLTEDEVTRRREEYGRNALPTQAGAGLLKVILSQFTNIMVIVLLVAALISLFLGDVKDVIVILVIVVLNAALGTFQEYRAEQALAALSAMQVP